MSSTIPTEVQTASEVRAGDFIMLLEDKVREFENSGIMLHIGSASGFFFIGTAEEFFSIVKKIEKGWKTYFNDAAKASKADYMRLKARKPLDIGLLAYTAKLSSLDVIAKRYVEKKKNFKPFEKRKVLNSYARIEPNTCAIIVEGDEMGAFSCRAEWEKAERYFPLCMKSKEFADSKDDDGEPYAEI